MTSLASITHPENSCPQCKSPKINFDATYGFYKCSSCEYVWAYSQDDPDYEDEAADSEDLIDDQPGCPSCGASIEHIQSVADGVTCDICFYRFYQF
ncbi:MAG: hypothetical protein KME60_07120 [Cyanomargarita calcarea GSE-NOS-MK-12-04C]|jgi:ribosomal protein L37AE/L43A|uniref:Uncharacterized protein n=1 Tax=Cyanomargarita calcarea GSE-NOS-MK-12-04C TaxID=2839659 RepID=A0A951QJT9_9CYAN|nr:hypothetical protein [Cyanomargarita calcarea GSE-NOS-MK-12-04C]